MAIGADLILNLHAFVRSVMKVGGDPRVFTRELLESAPEIVTIDEVGCGIVPIDAFEREYRDEAGVAGQLFASHADQAFRTICAIPQRIR
ncbi:MAG: bifunctional adenosylcobinamide kinase/adenosylcobinamide-phosphate guanylyltransferase [Lachnospiraceae bacterium]